MKNIYFLLLFLCICYTPLRNFKEVNANNLISQESNNKKEKLNLDINKLIEEAENAEELFLWEEAKNIREKILKLNTQINGIKHNNTAETLTNLGLLYKNLGDYEKAETLYKQSLEIRKKILGLEHPYTILAMNNLGFFYRSLGQFEKGNQLVNSFLVSNLNFIKREVPLLPLSSRIKFKDNFSFNEAIFSDLDKNIRNKQLALFSQINTKGLLEEIEKRQSELKYLTGQRKKIADEIKIINKKIANYMDEQKNIEDLFLNKEKLEKKLYRLLPSLNLNIVNIEDVIKVMPEDSILVEYVRYQPYINFEWKAPRYLALVLDPSKSEIDNSGNLYKYKIHALDLGLAENLENKIKNTLIAIEEGLKDADKLLRDISKIIIKPIAELTQESNTWFISPEGELNKIPFAALGLKNNDYLLSDQIKIRLLTTGRELIDLYEKKKSKSNFSFVIANPLFDREGKKITKPYLQLYSLNKNSSNLYNVKWKSLPGTAKEGKLVAKKIKASLLVEAEATATKVINIKKPKILHIASHSFYLENKSTNIEYSKKLLKSRNLSRLNYLSKNENPLLRSGIVLAGANNLDTNEEDDGYLTALEVTQLDLNDTELVVISGCESGKEYIKNGDAIYGLKRAISVAGSESSVLSLWKVDDQVTAEFMSKFYQRLITGEGKSEALLNTQLEFRNHKNKDFRHPYYWAAFQLSGDWNSIDF